MIDAQGEHDPSPSIGPSDADWEQLVKPISAVRDRLDGICAACHRHDGLEQRPPRVEPVSTCEGR